MIALCIESSNIRGMGHLFRSILLVEYLRHKDIPFLYMINDDEMSLSILEDRNIDYITVDFDDALSNWESKIIDNYNISIWINDKYITSEDMGLHIKGAGIKFCVLDDMGPGEQYADVFIGGMIAPIRQDIKCKKKCIGSKYIILNPEIDIYKRKRVEINRILVTLGGSDPHGVTIEVVQELKKIGLCADILIGPDFALREELLRMNDNAFKIMQNVPSVIALFEDYDFAITGGGQTCCEAMASGLPCLIIANAEHEEKTGLWYESKNACLYAGMYGLWNRNLLNDIYKLNIENMSERGMALFDTGAIRRIISIIMNEDSI